MIFILFKVNLRPSFVGCTDTFPRIKFLLIYTPLGVKAIISQLSDFLHTYFRSEEAPLCRFGRFKITIRRGYGIPPNLAHDLFMPAKNKPNHAKASLFPRFKANSTS